MLETRKTYAECSAEEKAFVTERYGGPLPDSAVVHVDRGYLCVESLNLDEVAAMQDHFLDISINLGDKLKQP